MSTQQMLLQAIDLKKHYPVKKGLFAPERLVKALDGVSFTLERGKTLAVVGESGCGKSTLGRLLTMIEVPTGGELYYQGQDLLKHDPQAQKLPESVWFAEPAKKSGADSGRAAADQQQPEQRAAS